MKRHIVDLIAAAEIGFNLPRGSITGSRGAPRIARARQIVMYAARREGYTLAVIGRVLGRDHTTVLHGIARCQTIWNLDWHLSVIERAYADGLGSPVILPTATPRHKRFKAGGQSRAVRTKIKGVRVLFRATAKQRMSMSRLAAMAGLSVHALHSWKRGVCPRGDNLARALRVVGLKLTIEPIKNEGDDGVLPHREVGNVSALQGPIPSLDQAAPGHPR